MCVLVEEKRALSLINALHKIRIVERQENAAFMARADMLEISLHFLKQSQGNFHEEKQVTRLAIRWNMRVTVYQIWLDSGWSVQTQEVR